MIKKYNIIKKKKMEEQNQNRNINRMNLNKIKFGYISHLVLHSLIAIFNSMVYDRMLWVYAILSFFYIIFLFLYLMLFFCPVVIVIMIFLCGKNDVSLKRIKKLTLLSTIASLIIGCTLCCLLWSNILKFNDFYENCPYSFLPDEIKYFLNFDNYNLKENIKKCGYKRCFYYNYIKSDILPYEYLCNFDSSKDFGKKNDGSKIYETTGENEDKKTSNFLIKCELINDINNNIKSSAIKNYTNLCSAVSDFYICKRLNEATIFEISSGYKCPEKNIYIKLYLFGVFCIFINILFPIVLFFIDIITYKKLKRYFRSIERILNDASQSKTANSSNKHESYDSKNNSTFKKEGTELIIVENKNNDNDKNIIININKKTNDNNFKQNENSIENKEQKNKEKDLKDEIMENNIICLKLKNNKKEKDNNGKIKDVIDIMRSFTRKTIKVTDDSENQREQNASKELFNVDTANKEKSFSDIIKNNF